MNLDALIFMLCAWGFTLGLLGFCIANLLKKPEQDFNNTIDSED